VLREDGRLAATTWFEPHGGNPTDNPAAKSRDYVRRHWKYHEPAPEESGNLMERARSHSFCISGMAFQDAWNIDLDRLRRCCVHVITPGGKLIPFCTYYMTDSSGRRLVERN